MGLQNPADKGKEMPGLTLRGSPSHLHDDTISHSTVASFFPFHIFFFPPLLVITAEFIFSPLFTFGTSFTPHPRLQPSRAVNSFPGGFAGGEALATPRMLAPCVLRKGGKEQIVQSHPEGSDLGAAALISNP